MLRNLIVQAELIGDLLDELVVNVLRYSDRDGGDVLSAGCRGYDMTIALCDTVASGAGAPKESEDRKSGVDEVRTVLDVTMGRSSNGSSRAAMEGSADGSTNGSVDGPADGADESGDTAGIVRTCPADRVSWRFDDLGSGRRKLQP